MKQVSKTDFSATTSPELASVDEVLQIVSNKTAIGYFVPVGVYERLIAAEFQLRNAGEHPEFEHLEVLRKKGASNE